MPEKTALHALNLVDIQTGSVVSRTLIDKPQGTVTLFAYDLGQSLSEHTAPYDALIHVLLGKIQVTVGEAKYEVAAGEIFLIPANEPHAVFAMEPTKMILTMVKG